jgi:hypothetical protein
MSAQRLPTRSLSLVSTSAKHCPGYVKNATSGNPTADKFSGSVSASTAGFKIPGKYSGEVCISASGNITSPKPLKVG